jgi:hypothetical protein
MLLRAIGILVFSLALAGQGMADEVIDGRFGPGALYRIVRPTNWNGALLLYAHGEVDSRLPVGLPPEGDLIINLLTQQGFAVAFSSFSENGWAVKDGSQRTQQLLGIFTSKFGQPRRVYISGASMGGLIAIKLVEDHPGFFAGAVPTCAAAGGAQQEFDYFGNTRVLFDFFYPGALPGNAGDVPEGVDPIQGIFLPAVAAMQNNPTGALAIAAINQTPIPFATPTELLESIATALAAHALWKTEYQPPPLNQPAIEYIARMSQFGRSSSRMSPKNHSSSSCSSSTGRTRKHGMPDADSS